MTSWIVIRILTGSEDKYSGGGMIEAMVGRQIKFTGSDKRIERYPRASGSESMEGGTGWKAAEIAFNFF